jgi:4-amino-4-deoxy-L-arabinose transferase-like glycosyltransferase
MVLAVFHRPAAVFTVLLYAFQPAIVEVQSDVMTEAAFMFFLLSAQWLIWRVLEEPSAVRGALLGAAAAGAYLTRPEGILAIALAAGWPLLLLFRPGRRGARLAGLAATLAVFILAASPYLYWVKSVRGHWALSPRQSAKSLESELGLGQTREPDASDKPPAYYYGIFGKSVLRLTVYGLWIPFAALGIRSVKGFRSRFYFSLPLAHLAAILYTLRTHPFMSDRYIMVPMTLLGALAGCGLASVCGALARKYPEARWGPAACGALVFVVAVLPTMRILQARRVDCLSYPVAAAKILEQGSKPRGMSGPVEQVAYLCGARSYYSGQTHEGIRRQVDDDHVEYYVYSERDLNSRKDYIRMLQTCPALQAPVEVKGPPGTLTVYYQRSK